MRRTKVLERRRLRAGPMPERKEDISEWLRRAYPIRLIRQGEDLDAYRWYAAKAELADEIIKRLSAESFASGIEAET